MSAVKWVGVLAALALMLPASAPAAAPGRQGAAAPRTLEAVPAQRSFQPPADGKLTADQVKMYIAVRRRAMANAPKSNEGAADQFARALASLTSDASAAADAGVDVDEYRWVSARIAEASSSGASPGNAELIDAINAAISRPSEASGLPGASPSAQADAARTSAARVAYNRRLLEKYQSDLDALRTSRP